MYIKIPGFFPVFGIHGLFQIFPVSGHPVNFVKVIVGFQFHFNRLNGCGKIVDEKKGNISKYIHLSIHPSIHLHALNEKIALFSLWTRPYVIFGKTLTC